MTQYNWAGKGVNFSSDTFKATILTSSYTFSSSHEYLDDVNAYETSATGFSATGVTLSTSFSSPVLTVDAADFGWSGLTGDDYYYLVIYKDTGSASTSVLLGIENLSASVTGGGTTNGSISITVPTEGLFQVRYNN